MQTNRRHTLRFPSGFTLVELLIVIAILAILSTLGVANFQSARLKARDISRKSDLQTIAKSLEAYANDYRSYPRGETLTGKIICISPTTTCSWGSAFTDTKGTIYAAKLPQDTLGTYWYVSDGTSFSLYARLENPNDPAIVTPAFSAPISCGTNIECNYKISSSNIQ